MKRKLIIQLIAEDMKHEQLLGALKNAGFNSDLHELNIMLIVAKLMGISKKKISWEWTDIYMHYISRVMEYELTGNGKNLMPFAKQCYNALSIQTQAEINSPKK